MNFHVQVVRCSEECLTCDAAVSLFRFLLSQVLERSQDEADEGVRPVVERDRRYEGKPSVPVYVCHCGCSMARAAHCAHCHSFMLLCCQHNTIFNLRLLISSI